MDCIYQNMHSYKYTLVIDLDEVIVPYKDANLTQMMDRITKVYKINYAEALDFKFRNSFFFTDHPYPDKGRLDARMFFKYRKRKAFQQETLQNFPKSISNPQTCLLRDQHFCQPGASFARSFKYPTKTKRRIVDINPRIGNVHHYRHCPQNVHDKRSVNTCLQYFAESYFVDNRILHFEEQLENQVTAVKSQLHGNSVY